MIGLPTVSSPILAFRLPLFAWSLSRFFLAGAAFATALEPDLFGDPFVGLLADALDADLTAFLLEAFLLEAFLPATAVVFALLPDGGLRESATVLIYIVIHRRLAYPIDGKTHAGLLTAITPICIFPPLFEHLAQVAELVDALASGASGLMVVEVQVLFWAP